MFYMMWNILQEYNLYGRLGVMAENSFFATTYNSKNYTKKYTFSALQFFKP